MVKHNIHEATLDSHPSTRASDQNDSDGSQELLIRQLVGGSSFAVDLSECGICVDMVIRKSIFELPCQQYSQENQCYHATYSMDRT